MRIISQILKVIFVLNPNFVFPTHAVFHNALRIYICVCVSIIHIYTYIYIQIYKCNIYTLIICMCVYICVCVYIYICIHIYIYTALCLCEKLFVFSIVVLFVHCLIQVLFSITLRFIVHLPSDL